MGEQVICTVTVKWPDHSVCRISCKAAQEPDELWHIMMSVLNDETMYIRVSVKFIPKYTYLNDLTLSWLPIQMKNNILSNKVPFLTDHHNLTFI